jgi:hypothetical protein
VLDGIGKELQLDEGHLEASRSVLRDYGNVSSSTTWYTLGWVESVRGAKKGDLLLQIGVGSGIKCGVNVWRALRDVHDVQVRAARGAVAGRCCSLRLAASVLGPAGSASPPLACASRRRAWRCRHPPAAAPQDAWAHVATDRSVLRRRGRHSGSALGSLLALLLLLALAALAAHCAQGAGLLEGLPFDVDGRVRRVVAPVVAPFVQKAQQLLGVQQ